MFQMDEDVLNEETTKEEVKEVSKKKANGVRVKRSPCVPLTPNKSPRGKKQPGLEQEPLMLNQTIIRLKRRIEDPPSKLLVVSYKRLKTNGGVVGEEGDESPSTSAGSNTNGDKTALVDSNGAIHSEVLRLVGTVPQDEADSKKIATTVRTVLATSSPSVVNSLRRDIKTRSTRMSEKARESLKENTEANRFKIVNSKRGVYPTDNNSVLDDSTKTNGVTEAKGNYEVETDLLNLLDLVPESTLEKPMKRQPPEEFKPGAITCNGVPMVKEITNIQSDDDDKNFVYDLYLTNDPHLEDYICGQLVSVEEFDEELDFGDIRESAVIPRNFEDDDDSNAEDNYRNDYPDSEEEGLRDDQDDSYGDGAAGNSSLFSDFDSKFNGLKIRDDSSDDEDLIYGIDDDGGNHLYDFDEKYRKFKRRVQTEFADEVVSSGSESDVDDEIDE